MAGGEYEAAPVRFGSGAGTGESWVQGEHGRRYSTGPIRIQDLPKGEVVGTKFGPVVREKR